MPKVKDVKTKSAPKRRHLDAEHKLLLSIFFVAIGLIVVCSVWLMLHVVRHPNEKYLVAPNGITYTLQVASTPQALTKGLGGRASMPKHAGMIFIFAQPAIQCFWMKDMHFPLDMIWLNGHKQVVAVKEDVSPKTYPKMFCPAQFAQYVIELNAGQVKAAAIHTGQTLSFSDYSP